MQKIVLANQDELFGFARIRTALYPVDNGDNYMPPPLMGTLRRIGAILAGKGRDVHGAAYDPDDDTPPDDDPVVLPLEDHIDLHPFAPRDIPSVVEEYVWQCHEEGLREVRLIHGRGKGVQRRIVQSALGKNPLVESCHDAPPERGGWGATVAVIREKEHGE